MGYVLVISLVLASLRRICTSSKVFLEIFAVNSCKNSQSLASIFFSSEQALRCISIAL